MMISDLSNLLSFVKVHDMALKTKEMLKTRIDELDWMDAPTKATAKAVMLLKLKRYTAM